MKTAEEWIADYYVTHTISDPDEELGYRTIPLQESFIKAIQLDARKQGMTDAAGLHPTKATTNWGTLPENMHSIGYNKALDDWNREILIARDNLK